MQVQNEVMFAVTEEQYHIIINALNELRTRCIKDNIDSTDVDYLLLDIIDGKLVKEKEKSKGDYSNDAR